MRTLMARAFAAVAIFVLLPLLALGSACGGGGGATIDIRDFDTARFTISQTTTSDGDVAQLVGTGVIDNRRQALSVTLEGESSPVTIAIGPTVYTYNEDSQSWEAFTEQPDGQVGFGRPYWPQFWRDAVKIQNLGGESRPSGEATRYLLTYDPDKVQKRLQLSAGGTEETQLVRAEVEVWVDQATRYAVELTFRLELAPGAQTTKIEVTSTFSDFGTEVQIEAPQLTSATPAATESAPTEPSPTPAGP
jgi:hypothetical protein